MSSLGSEILKAINNENKHVNINESKNEIIETNKDIEVKNEVIENNDKLIETNKELPKNNIPTENKKEVINKYIPSNHTIIFCISLCIIIFIIFRYIKNMQQVLIDNMHELNQKRSNYQYNN